jgi:hypothetical protein
VAAAHSQAAGLSSETAAAHAEGSLQHAQTAAIHSETAAIHSKAAYDNSKVAEQFAVASADNGDLIAQLVEEAKRLSAGPEYRDGEEILPNTAVAIINSIVPVEVDGKVYFKIGCLDKLLNAPLDTNSLLALLCSAVKSLNQDVRTIQIDNM